VTQPAAGGTLVLVAHGTRDPAGEAVLAALARRVRAARPGRRVELAFLEISSPSLADVLTAAAGPAVVVPLLLAGGYHVHIDLPSVVTAVRPGTLVARQLGPHPLLTSVLARRLASAGLRPTDTVILGAAGSSDPSAPADVRAAARLLSVRLCRPVTAAFASAGSPSVADALDRLGSGPAPRIAVASYLLAPGFFQNRLESYGAGLVSAPLGVDADLAALAWARHDETLREAYGEDALETHGEAHGDRAGRQAPAHPAGRLTAAQQPQLSVSRSRRRR
jgi:sirohydrochlorin ferrochelatase